MKPIAFVAPPIEEDILSLPIQQYAASDYVFPGIYFLYHGVTLTYIGQSDNVLARISNHRANGKIFDTFSVFRCGQEWLLPLEAAFIRKFNPPENRAHNGSDMHANRSVDPAPMVAAARFVSGAQERPRLVPAKLAAEYMGVSKSFLDKLRMTNDGPPVTRLGSRVYYSSDDIDEWLKTRHNKVAA